MDRGQADVLVGDLASALGIPSLALDDGGMCILALEEGDDRVIVSIGHRQCRCRARSISCAASTASSRRRAAMPMR